MVSPLDFSDVLVGILDHVTAGLRQLLLEVGRSVVETNEHDVEITMINLEVKVEAELLLGG